MSSLKSLSADQIYESDVDDGDYNNDEGTQSEGEGQEEEKQTKPSKLERERARLTEKIARTTASLDLISNVRELTPEDKALIKEYAKSRGYDHRVRFLFFFFF